MATSVLRRDVASLLDENRRLRVELKSCEMARRQVERQSVELQARAHQAATAAAQQMRRKEAEWITEYDRSVQALLKIVQHHEDEKAQLKMELERLGAAAEVIPSPITKMTRATQTETLAEVALRKNSVRFAKEEDGVMSGYEKRPSVDAKTKASMARMQQLFEQLQSSRDRQVNASVDIPDAKDRLDAGSKEDGSKHRSLELRCGFKAAVQERLEHQTEPSTVRRHQHLASAPISTDSTRKTSQTQTEEIGVPKQKTASIALRQDLEERNQLLYKRLASQQKVLDQLLLTKLKHASSSADECDPVPSSPSDVVREGAGNDQADAQNKHEYFIPTVIPAARCLARHGDVRIPESTVTTERQPLSPPAA